MSWNSDMHTRHHAKSIDMMSDSFFFFLKTNMMFSENNRFFVFLSHTEKYIWVEF